MKTKTIMSAILIALSLNAISQTLYVPSGTSGIGTSSNANVGIGISSPITKFDVRGNIYIPDGSSYWIGAIGDAGNRLRLHHNGNNAYIDYYQNLYLRSGSGGLSTNFTLTSDGKLGIGTTNPDPNYKLTLFQSTNCGMLLDNGTFQWVIENTFDNGDQMAGCLSIRQNGIKRLLLYRDQGAIFGSSGTYFKDMTGTWKGYFNIDFTNSSHPNFEMLELVNGQENKIFSIQQDGTMHLDGKIYAKEIEVKANVWADYVFKKDYKLMSISELESFIKDNNKLPEVPNETDAKEKGVNVGDMNALLLKKVEELTLYAIQQQKEIEALKNDIRSLKK